MACSAPPFCFDYDLMTEGGAGTGIDLRKWATPLSLSRFRFGMCPRTNRVRTSSPRWLQAANSGQKPPRSGIAILVALHEGCATKMNGPDSPVSYQRSASAKCPVAPRNNVMRCLRDKVSLVAQLVPPHKNQSILRRPEVLATCRILLLASPSHRKWRRLSIVRDNCAQFGTTQSATTAALRVRGVHVIAVMR